MLESLCPQYPELPSGLRARVVVEVTDAVLRHRSLMPRYVKWPLSLLFWLFHALAYPLKGAAYSSLEPEQQASYLRLWENSPLGTFVQLHRSLVVLTFLDHPDVLGVLAQND